MSSVMWHSGSGWEMIGNIRTFPNLDQPTYHGDNQKWQQAPHDFAAPISSLNSSHQKLTPKAELPVFIHYVVASGHISGQGTHGGR